MPFALADIRHHDEKAILFRGLKGAIIMLDPTGRIADWNAGGVRITSTQEDYLRQLDSAVEINKPAVAGK